VTKQDQEDIRRHYQEQYISVPRDFVFETCDHPIEKWCSNCDRDFITHDKIPHFRKYKEFHVWTHEEFEREMKDE
jgi:hypothetical protein